MFGKPRAPSRRHAGAGSGQGLEPHRPALDGGARRPPLRWTEPPAAAYFYSPDRPACMPRPGSATSTASLQADAFSGFGRLYEPGRKPGPIHDAACWAMPTQVLRAGRSEEGSDRDRGRDADRCDLRHRARAHGLAPDETCAHRRARSAALVTDLETWLRENRADSRPKAPTQRRSTTCSSAGPPSPGSSTTGASALEQRRRTLNPSLAVGRPAIGPSPARMRAGIARLPSTR